MTALKRGAGKNGRAMTAEHAVLASAAAAGRSAPAFRPIATAGPSGAAQYREWRPCPVCGGVRHRPLLDFDDFQFYTDAARPKRVPIRHVQCLGCFAAFMNPVFNAEGFAVLFAEGGASYGSSSGRQDEQIGWLERHGLLASGMTLLDIGCYEGSFIGKLPAGVTGVGVDIDAPAIERACRRFASQPHRFICADFERFETEAAIDVITMFHVLEHVPRPVSVLRRLAEMATPGTRLLVEVPIVENVIYGDICGFLTVQHLTHFSRASLRNVLCAAGWREVSGQSMAGYNGFRVIAELAASAAGRPDRDDVGRIFDYLSRWYGAVRLVEARIAGMCAARCVLRGGGLQTENLYHLTSLFAGDREFIVADRDALKQGKSWRGIDIVAPDALSALDWRGVQMVLGSYSHQEAMRAEARAAGIPDAAVVPLYDRIYRY